MNECGNCPNGDLVPYYFEDNGVRSCIRSEGHENSHLIRTERGAYVIFETDLECGCDGCQSPDPIEWCEVYGEITEAEAMEMLRRDGM